MADFNFVESLLSTKQYVFSNDTTPDKREEIKQRFINTMMESCDGDMVEEYAMLKTGFEFLLAEFIETVNNERQTCKS